jgi:1,4-dihydroxy-2-naphthoate octaprenyltransferase
MFEYAIMLLAAYGVPVLLLVLGLTSAWILLPLLTLPLGLGLLRALVQEEGKALNPVLVGTARLLVLHGLLFTVGLAVGG